MSRIREHSQQTKADPSSLGPKWFAAYTATNHEKHVLELLADKRIEAFLPLYNASRQWKKRKPVTLQLPLFPNYVFVRISAAERGAVLGTPGIFSIVGSGASGWELPEQEIKALRNSIFLRKIEPHAYLAVGERVRIKFGVLAGLEGVVLRKKTNLRIVLTLDRIMQSVAIEVHADELECIPQARTEAPSLYCGYMTEARP